MGYGKQEGSMHATGMLSCQIFFQNNCNSIIFLRCEEGFISVTVSA